MTAATLTHKAAAADSSAKVPWTRLDTMMATGMDAGTWRKKVVWWNKGRILWTNLGKPGLPGLPGLPLKTTRHIPAGCGPAGRSKILRIMADNVAQLGLAETSRRIRQLRQEDVEQTLILIQRVETL